MVATQGMNRYGLQVGTPAIESVGPITFGPDNILFVADNVSATIFAIEVSDEEAPSDPVALDNLDSRLAAYLGCPRDEVDIRDMAVHPSSRAVYLSVLRGSGNTAVPLIIRIGANGELAEVSFEQVAFTQAAVADAPSADDDRPYRSLAGRNEPHDEEREIKGVHLRLRTQPLRTQTVTDLAYIDGVLLVAGASNEEFVATLRRMPFPFNGAAEANSLEIFHVSHGKYETESPIRTFIPYGGNTSVLAAYTCTPVVHFSVADLRSGEQAKGRTVAELGAMNSPLDMVAFTRDGEEYLLVSNLRHPLMKIKCADIDAQGPLTTPTEVGAPRETLPHEGVSRLAVADGNVLMLQWIDDGLHLRSHSTASL